MTRLVFVDEPTRDPIELKEGETRLGRRPDNDVQFASGTVSGRHAVIAVAGETTTIQDLGSTNKTYVNGVPIDALVELNHNDQIQFGEATVRYESGLTHTGKPADNPLLVSGRQSGWSNSGQASSVLTDDPAFITSTLDSGGTQFGTLNTNPEAKLRAVLEISSRLADAHRLDEVLPTILDSLFGIFRQADRGCILLKDEKTDELVPRAMKHRNPGEDATIRLSRTVTNRVIESKEGILSEDAANDDAFDGSESIADLKIHSIMCVPMLSRQNEPIGIISIDSQSQMGRFTQPDLDILYAIAGQAALAYENARLLETYLLKEKLDNEMEIARGVQNALLPQDLPQADGYEFFASYDAAQAVGGDYYDAMRLPDGKICLSFGDVAGKGVPGALIMSRMNSCVRNTMKHVHDVEEAMLAINEHMCDSAVEGRFVTYLLVVIDPETGEIWLSNAGHMPPFIRHANGEVESFDDDELVGPPIGVVDDFPYDVENKVLQPGDLVVMVTDGVDEAMNPEGELYTGERVEDFVKNGPTSASEMGKALLADVRRHANGRAQNDDITIMTFGRNAT